MRTLIFILLVLIPVCSYADVVEKIEIEGLKWTKERFIRRELLFKEGDQFSKEKLKKSIRNLLNTHLFYRITPEVEKKDGKVVLKLRCKERFPIVPLPRGRIKSKSAKAGLEVRDYNLGGMGNHLFAGYIRWFGNGNRDREGYVSTNLYKFIKGKFDLGAGVSASENYDKDYIVEGEKLGKYDVKNTDMNVYITLYLDPEKIHKLTLGQLSEFSRYSDWISDKDEHYLTVGYTVDRTTDMVYYVKGSSFSVFSQLAEPSISSVFTGNLYATYSNSIRKRNFDTAKYSFSAGTKVGYSGGGFTVLAGIPGYESEKLTGKRFACIRLSYRMAVLDKSFFIEPTLFSGEVFNGSRANYLLSPGLEAEAFWAKLVDGIIRFKLFRGVGNGGSTTSLLKLDFRW